mmetsp:Transcript_34543/g.87336  ORF Transcript_34543/g.87336 Transcript_34543/m.87336 type:complete len:266 (+) Transcript_34543:786-1583(+)
MMSWSRQKDTTATDPTDRGCCTRGRLLRWLIWCTSGTRVSMCRASSSYSPCGCSMPLSCCNHSLLPCMRGMSEYTAATSGCPYSCTCASLLHPCSAATTWPWITGPQPPAENETRLGASSCRYLLKIGRFWVRISMLARRCMTGRGRSGSAIRRCSLDWLVRGSPVSDRSRCVSPGSLESAPACFPRASGMLEPTTSTSLRAKWVRWGRADSRVVRASELSGPEEKVQLSRTSWRRCGRAPAAMLAAAVMLTCRPCRCSAPASCS